MPDIAHQKQIKDKMAKEDAWNLFGEWWKDEEYSYYYNNVKQG